MRKVLIIFLIFLLFTGCQFFKDNISVSQIKCDFKINPTGIGKNPAFSWILESKLRNQQQSAYHILVSDNISDLNNNIGNCWDSEVVLSNQSINVKYSGNELQPGKVYLWKVRVWDKDGNESQWSETGKFITALYNENDWKEAKWISYEEMEDSLVLVPGVHPWGKNVRDIAKRRPVIPLFRKEFISEKKIESASLFISGLGHYKAYINGEQISDEFLSPGWTDYQKTCLYNTYDITKYIINGKNVIGAVVGNGFHNVNNERYRKLLITYGMPKLIALLKFSFTDGTEEIIITNDSWKTSPSPITFSSIYGGESYDAGLEQEGWNEPVFNDEKWNNVLITKGPGGILKPENSYPVKVNEIFGPIDYYLIGTDTVVYDFGQNASGIVRIKVQGQKGQKIILRPGELIQENKQINQKHTGKPYYYEYTLKGDEEEIYQPMFTIYGLRYVQVENALPTGEDNEGELPEIIDIEFLHIYNSAPKTGTFSCSNELFNNIFKLILYAIQSNSQSVYTDCIHREKLGWLEQSFLMGGSIHYNYEVYHMYKKIIQDMMDAQEENGLIPNIAPEFVYFGGDFTDSPEWGSAGIILPYLLYKWYGDISMIHVAWPMMMKYIEYLKNKSDNLIVKHGLSDWYDLGLEKPGFCQLTPQGLTATAFFYYDAMLMFEMAKLINYDDEANALKQLADDIKTAFNNEFFNNTAKVYGSGSQTSMAIPYAMGLVNEEDKENVITNLVDSINANDKALTAGDIGFHYLIEALTKGGASQLIYEMNNRDDVPGYGYQIKKGATALTESWTASELASNNHMMLGHLMEWFYTGLGGIQQSETSIAYKEITIKPTIVGDLTFVKTSFISPYGIIKSEWRLKDDNLNLNITIPVNTTAIVYLPTTNGSKIYEDDQLITEKNIIEILGKEDNFIKVQVGSGNYKFSVLMN